MKNIFITLFTVFFLLSCSDNDNDNNDNSNETQSYLPLNNGKYWVYDTQTSNAAGRDSLYIANDTLIEGKSYKKFKTKNTPTGFYSGALSGNGIRQEGSKLLVSGGTSVILSEEFPISLAVNDFVLFDANATAGSILSTKSGMLEQPVDDIYTIKIEYGMSSMAQQDRPTYTTPDGTTYTNVKVVTITLNIKITAIVTVDTFTIPIEIMPAQDALVSTQYYAEGVGAIRVVTDIDYELIDTSSLNINVTVPESGSEHQEEVLIDYN
ncbi:hypothetical protein [Flavobacterium rhizosphaerae]|uniref:Uncharacterized protein n=1 Tax=Flavobacterium rhizosphaerae TaxID=3163298 RepID=A0ABW8YYH1_9FLAO